MEIEAKFTLPDEQVLEILAGLSELDGHPLSVPVRRTMTDVYLDTQDRLIRAAGYTCRKRSSRKKALVTVKRLQRGGPQSPWSQLRDKERDPVYSAIKEKFPARYQQLIEQYYKSFDDDSEG